VWKWGNLVLRLWKNALYHSVVAVLETRQWQSFSDEDGTFTLRIGPAAGLPAEWTDGKTSANVNPHLHFSTIPSSLEETLPELQAEREEVQAFRRQKVADWQKPDGILKTVGG